MQTKLPVFSSLVIVALCLAPRVALAQQDCKTQMEAGKAAENAGQHEEARAVYERAYRNCGDPVALVLIAKTYQNEGKLEKALQYAERFLAEVDATHPLYDALTKAVAELRSKVAARETGESVDGAAVTRGESMSRSIDAVDDLRPIEHRLNSAQPFAILERPLAGSSGGLDAAFLLETDSSDLVVLRLDAHIEHMATASIGVLASIPFTFVFADGENDSGAGNLDVGGFYVLRLGRSSDLIARGSVVVPTSSGDNVLVNLASAPVRIADLVLAAPDIVVARTSASFIHHLGATIMLRADLGFDTPVVATGDGEIDDRKPLLHLSAGAAWGRRTKIVGEIVNITALESTDGEDAFHQVALGVSHHVGGTALRGTISFLIDSFISSQADTVAIGVGVAHKY